MSKFKVGDKVWYSGEVYKINEIALDENNEVCAIGLENKLDYYVDEDDLKLYKTPQERLIELGWIIDKDDTNPATIEFYYKDNKVLIIDKALKVIKTLYPINLELAEILVDYLKELRDGTI